MADRVLKPQWFHILLALSGRDLHGYAIQRAVLAQTDQQLRLWPATLYRSLERMEEAELIAQAGAPGCEPPDERRRYYSITPLGRERLRDEAERMARWVAAVGVEGMS
jgi:DNA-binding PadR family transcriptional regulator